jgi:hypothetical protein
VDGTARFSFRFDWEKDAMLPPLIKERQAESAIAGSGLSSEGVGSGGSRLAGTAGIFGSCGLR